jgi:hypothetical protein
MPEHNNAQPQPAAESTTRTPTVGRTLTPAQMYSAIAKGLATSPLFRQDIQRYDGAWWQESEEHGWLEHTDAATIATLDRRAASITNQQKIALRNAAIRKTARSVNEA